ncbi:hypothetical protein DL766_004740 [Monosporascus sp. MC13-8B]|uniref:Uncharacterized protein n=1 Tax=Monosporascus cannonballus TaxID=155416 RepID=A0ABY0H1G1_9PEZI|nr:hypothetical protein DL762_006653 [Monosporascus cannonballus]RYO88472.1 hypothetical protein DL763_005971 [Monosporascus cannonballus]RYP30728.1 hypothetical protein DL766_004740 [Monosporascus sp. MC13-8B]
MDTDSAITMHEPAKERQEAPNQSNSNLMFMNGAIAMVATIMIMLWFMVTLFFFYHFRKPLRQSSLEDAIELYQLKSPRGEEPELWIFAVERGARPPPAVVVEAAQGEV